MNKKLLSDYIDACELIKETEEDIKKLKRNKKTIIQTNVKGSNPNFPYEEKHFHIEGMKFPYIDDVRLRREEQLLEERRENAEKVKVQVESELNSIPVRMQRIIKAKYFEGLSWQQVADRLGRKATADSVRMEMERFFKEK